MTITTKKLRPNRKVLLEKGFEYYTNEYDYSIFISDSHVLFVGAREELKYNVIIGKGYNKQTTPIYTDEVVFKGNCQSTRDLYKAIKLTAI